MIIDNTKIISTGRKTKDQIVKIILKHLEKNFKDN